MARAGDDGPKAPPRASADDVIHAELVALIPRMRRFAASLAGSLEEGDDLVQAACERAISRIDQWQPGTRLDSWVFRIIRNIHLDRLRARSVRAEHLRLVKSADGHGVDGVREMDARLTLQAVSAFLARLPEEQRTVMMLVCVEGLSYREVADVLGVPLGTVTSRMARGRFALKEYVDQAGDTEAPAGGRLAEAS